MREPSHDQPVLRGVRSRDHKRPCAGEGVWKAADKSAHHLSADRPPRPWQASLRRRTASAAPCAIHTLVHEARARSSGQAKASRCTAGRRLIVDGSETRAKPHVLVGLRLRATQRAHGCKWLTPRRREQCALGGLRARRRRRRRAPPRTRACASLTAPGEEGLSRRATRFAPCAAVSGQGAWSAGRRRGGHLRSFPPAPQPRLPAGCGHRTASRRDPGAQNVQKRQPGCLQRPVAPALAQVGLHARLGFANADCKPPQRSTLLQTQSMHPAKKTASSPVRKKGARREQRAKAAERQPTAGALRSPGPSRRPVPAVRPPRGLGASPGRTHPSPAWVLRAQ